jgi:D-amino peptidase
MSKYYISADLEGVCGVTSLLQCYPKEGRTDDYTLAMEQFTAEVNSLVEAILMNDSDSEILLNDAHNTMTNLSLSTLSPKVQLLSGKPKLCAMMAGLDSTFDGVFLLGYHAKAGTDKGVLNHTFHHKLFDVQINGKSYGEGGINALYASLVFKIPILLASGDRAFCQEIQQLIPDLCTVETKVGLSTTAAHSHPKQHVLDTYQDELHEVLTQGETTSLIELDGPYTLRITFINSLACDVVMTSPLYRRLDGRTVEMKTDKFQTMYQSLQSAYTMLAYTNYME